MITGAHLLLYSEDPEADRAFWMCDDLPAVMKRLAERQVRCTETAAAPWGSKTTISLPSGGEIGLYQSRQPVALGLKSVS